MNICTKLAMIDLKTGQTIKTFKTLASAGRGTGINEFNIRSVCNGHRHHAGGYDWKFINEGE